MRDPLALAIAGLIGATGGAVWRAWRNKIVAELRAIRASVDEILALERGDREHEEHEHEHRRAERERDEDRP